MNDTKTAEALEESPCVTWLLSVKNSLPFLRQTLESIRCQTYQNHKLLVWDDCSTDGTLEELERWVPQMIPGKIFSGRSLRLGASLAFLVEQADTELCARIDGDDVNLPDRLELQVQYMQAHPEVGVLGSLTLHIDEHGSHCPSWYYPITDADIRWRSRWQPSICHPTVMFRRSVVLTAGNYRDFQVEDFDLWMRMSLSTEFHNLAKPLVQYRRYSSSLTGEVDDFYPLALKTATLNSTILFSDLKDPVEALALWRITHPSQLERANRRSPFGVLDSYRGLKNLRTAAIALARQVGKLDNYFTSTETFKNQQYRLRKRLVENCGFGKLYALRARRVASKREKHTEPQPAAMADSNLL